MVKLFLLLERMATEVNPGMHLIDLFQGCLENRLRQERRGDLVVANYTLIIKLDSDTPFEYAQAILSLAVQHGRIYKVALSVPKRKEYVHVILPLEEEKGPAPVRLLMCADGDVKGHAEDRKGHAKSKKKAETCVLALEGREVAKLVKDEAAGENDALNSKGIEAVVTRIKEGKVGSVILDPDAEVASAHAIRVLIALQAAELERLRIASTPRMGK